MNTKILGSLVGRGRIGLCSLNGKVGTKDHLYVNLKCNLDFELVDMF